MVKSLLLTVLLPAPAFAAKAVSPRAAVPALSGGLVPFLAPPGEETIPLIPYLTPVESLLPAPLAASAPAPEAQAPMSAAEVYYHASRKDVAPALRAALESRLGAEPAARFIADLAAFRDGRKKPDGEEEGLSASAVETLRLLEREGLRPERAFDGAAAPAAEPAPASFAPPARAAAPRGALRRALNWLDDRGVALDFEVRSSRKGPLGYADGVLYVPASAVSKAARLSREKGLSPEDGLVQLLLREQLRWTRIEDLRLEDEQFKELRWERPRSARAALKLFLKSRYHKAWSWLWNLRERMGAASPDDYSEQVPLLVRVGGAWREPFVQDVAFDPAGRRIYAAGEGYLHARRLSEDGSWDLLSGETASAPGATYLKVAVSPELGLVAAAAYPDNEIHLRSAEGLRMVKSFSAFGWISDPLYRKDPVAGLAFDARAKTLIVAGVHGHLEVRTLAGRLLQTIPAREGSLVVGAVFDPVSRTLLIVHASGSAAAWRAGEDGVLAEPAAWRRDWPSFHGLTSLSFDPRTRLVFVSERNGDLSARRWEKDGTVGPAAEHQQVGIWAEHGIAYDAARGALLAGGFGLGRIRLSARPPQLAWPWTGSRGQRTVLSAFLDLLRDRRYSYHAPSAAEALHWMRDPAWIREAWAALAKDVLARAPALPMTKGSVRWGEGARAELARRMPTLVRILESPRRLGLLAHALSFLRLLYPYNLANAAEVGALAWARKTGLEFPLGELTVVPVSESFRGHIVYVQDREGLLAVELKIPGQEHHRTAIFPHNYEIARALARDPRAKLVRPWAFARARGKVPMYGNSHLKFDRKEPLGVFVRGYREGKRYWNAQAYIERLARESGRPEREIRLDALADAAAGGIILHSMGWLGTTETFNDMHAENFRVHEEADAELVADFGAFYQDKRRLYKERRREMLLLMDEPDERSWLEEIAVRVALRLGRDARTVRMIRRELGLPVRR